MLVIFQFCLIAILLEKAFSSGVCYTNYECANITIMDLHIPDDNPKIKGEKDKASDVWYKYVNWLDNPAGDLKLHYYVKFYDWDHSFWKIKYDGTVNVYEKGELERSDWAKLARKALGLNNPYVKRPGKVRVNRNFLSGDKCIGLNLDSPWDPHRDYAIELSVTDDDKKFLTGHIERTNVDYIKKMKGVH